MAATLFFWGDTPEKGGFVKDARSPLLTLENGM